MQPEFNRFIREMAGKGRCDLTPLFRRADLFAALVEALAGPFLTAGATKVAALDAMGFVLGGAVAASLHAGVALIRKPGKVAWSSEGTTYTDYSGTPKGFEVASDAITPGDRVLIVDDWSETGAQLRAAISLVERLGGEVIGIAVVNADERAREELHGYRVHAVTEYSGGEDA